MSKGWIIAGVIVGAIMLIGASIAMSAIGMYNGLQTKEEKVNAAWAEVTNQYQRRIDLIPSLVSVVQGYATHEKTTLIGVTQARAAATSITMTPAMLNNAEAMAKFQKVQGELSGFLSKLMVASERYPELKADAQFIALQGQVEGTENRIAVARNRYINVVNEWNVTIRQFPTSVMAGMFGYTAKAQFTVENEKEINHAPVIKFN
jgi:LemA protein